MSEARRHLLARTYLNPPGLSGLGTVNSAEWRAAEIPSANCHASARGVAAIYARLPELLGANVLAEATRPWSDGPDVVLDRHTRFGLGFQLTQPDRPMGPGRARTATSAPVARSASTIPTPTSSSPTSAIAARVAAGRPIATAGCSTPWL